MTFHQRAAAAALTLIALVLLAHTAFGEPIGWLTHLLLIALVVVAWAPHRGGR